MEDHRSSQSKWKTKEICLRKFLEKNLNPYEGGEWYHQFILQEIILYWADRSEFEFTNSITIMPTKTDL